MVYEDPEQFATAIQNIFPKLMHYLEAEEGRELTGLDITPAQVNALMVLYINKSLTMGELASELFLAESAATRLVTRLVKQKLVRRRGDENDRRIVRVSLTSYGKELAQLVFERRAQRFKNLSHKLTETERESLVTSLKAVLRGFEELAPEQKEKK